MRDPNRISEILRLVEEIWYENPDLRFNQLVYNLQSDYSRNHGGYGLIEEPDATGCTKTGFDFFNLEDEKFIEYLRFRVVKRGGNRN